MKRYSTQISKVRINRRAVQLNIASRVEISEVEALLLAQESKCANIFCRLDITPSIMDIDHIIPFSNNGTHEITNIQLLCTPCNRRKASMSQAEFLRREGGLPCAHVPRQETKISPFLASADGRKTSSEIMVAILALARSESVAAKIWEAPTYRQACLIWRHVTKNGFVHSRKFCWGKFGRKWAALNRIGE